jgi:hypothetical protein
MRRTEKDLYANKDGLRCRHACRGALHAHISAEDVERHVAALKNSPELHEAQLNSPAGQS